MLELKNVSKKFDDKIILENFSYIFEPGKIYGIVGPSGSGKSTILNMISKLEKMDSGEIFINNKNIKDFKRNKIFINEIGYLFQNFILDENLTVLKNMQLIFGKHFDHDKFTKLKKELQLDINDMEKVYQLSGGEQQRLCLIRILMQDYNIILADEPTGSVDDTNRDIILNKFRDMANDGKLIIIVTHDKDVEKLCDEIIKLD